MTRTEAERLKERLQAEHPDRLTHTFVVAGDGDDCKVIKLASAPPAGDDAPAGTVRAGREPGHSHSPTDLPGGLPPHGAGF